ncbi:guanine nucleotide exchange protein for ADP-robosylation factor [Blastocladiella emersonii ATCC 22665]|nr:guanine nucleotide exchange protein for ADP-robosylation factor [Blastocladiella emersonii ATCC 22665]
MFQSQSQSRIPSQLGSATSANPAAVFVVAALEKLIGLKETKRLPKLRESATATLNTLKSLLDDASSDTAPRSAAPVLSPELMRKMFEPLQLACASRSAVIIAVSLDCIAKLISYNVLVDNVPYRADEDIESTHDLARPDGSTTAAASRPSTASAGPAATPGGASDSQPLIETAVELVCECNIGENTDEKVHLQVVKALLAAVSSSLVPIHGNVLLKAVRTTWNIFLVSKSPQIQMVAQGSLNQMMNMVFSRALTAPTQAQLLMAAGGSSIAGAALLAAGSASVRTSSIASTSAPPSQVAPESSAPSSPPTAPTAAAAAPPAEDDADSGAAASSSGGGAAAHVAPATASGSGELDSSLEASAQRLPLPASPAVPAQQEIVTAGPSGSSTSTMPSDQLLRRASVSFSRDPASSTPAELFARDAYIVFRALCKLSTKGINENLQASDIRSTAIQSRVLSLQLILLAIKSYPALFAKPCYVPAPAGPGVAPSSFLDASRTHLGLAVGRALASPVALVYKAALDVFVAVVLHLRHAMKKEIEVFLSEVLLNIMEMKAATPTQKVSILAALTEIMRKPQILVEIYINYDCNPEALDNIYERLLNVSAKLVSAPQLPADPPTPQDLANASDVHRAALEALCASLHSLAEWIAVCKRSASPDGGGNAGAPHLHHQHSLSTASTPATPGQPGVVHLPGTASPVGNNGNNGLASAAASPATAPNGALAASASATDDAAAGAAAELEDNPEELINRKQQKMLLNEAIQLFNKKPKKGIQFLVDRGVLPSKSPELIAHWLINTEGLNKRELGDYLGEGDEDNIAIMHAFVDALEFGGQSFVDALRHFLQHFRLPGESQKIDRFMLKFAERYYAANRDHAENVFANPDTAYVLAYSVIMLNTDLHNPQVRKRMTKDDFVRNNRGINDNKDLPVEFLHGVFDAIAANEIKLKDDPLAAAAAKAAVASITAVSVSRKARREAFALALEEIATKVEVAFDSKRRRKYGTWIAASHSEHVRNMFEVTWMANLAALSMLLQKSADAAETAMILDAFKHCIVVSCSFDLDLERNAFVTTLSNFTLLNNANEMREKNFGAIKTLLDVALTQGNAFKKSWLDVLRCISQLERFHVVASEDPSGISNALQQETTSQGVVVATDKIYSGSVKLNGTAIVDFVEALCTVSWDEIPRMYSLTKLVEISYYNMNRIRVEWVAIWAILGQHFNRIGCHANEQVAYFAMDSLRQLSMKFLEMAELSNFKFQREFLRPFEHVVAHQPSSNVREMVVQCIQQMVQARHVQLRSGWKAILAVFAVIAAQETSEKLFSFSYDVVKAIESRHLGAVREHGYFTDAVTTLVAYCRAKLSQKVSLQAVEAIHRGIRVLADADKVDEAEWFAALHALYTVIVECELEVRTRALNYLFSALRDHGARFSAAFWQRIASEILFELFAPVTRPGAVPRGEDLSIWLSTTLIAALRQFIDLFGTFYDQLVHKLGDVLVLLKACILQENETLARLGTSCLQQLMESNYKHLHNADWDLVCGTWKELFVATTAYALQDPATVAGTPEEQQAKFQQIIVKCVLQLLLIQTVLEVTSVDHVYASLQSRHLLMLVDTLEASYEFARAFNGNLELRTSLWKSGFTKQLPNLLKQETSSVTCLLHILFHMYGDASLDRMSVLPVVEAKLIPLAVNILEAYRDLDPDSRKRNASAWKPVLLTILNGLVLFDDDSFKRHIKRFYRLSIDLLMYEVSEELRPSLHAVLIRTEQFIEH